MSDEKKPKRWDFRDGDIIDGDCEFVDAAEYDELARKLEIAKRALREINSHYSMTNEFSQSLAEDALKEIE